MVLLTRPRPAGSVAWRRRRAAPPARCSPNTAFEADSLAMERLLAAPRIEDGLDVHRRVHAAAARHGAYLFQWRAFCDRARRNWQDAYSDEARVWAPLLSRRGSAAVCGGVPRSLMGAGPLRRTRTRSPRSTTTLSAAWRGSRPTQRAGSWPPGRRARCTRPRAWPRWAQPFVLPPRRLSDGAGCSGTTGWRGRAGAGREVIVRCDFFFRWLSLAPPLCWSTPEPAPVAAVFAHAACGCEADGPLCCRRGAATGSCVKAPGRGEEHSQGGLCVCVQMGALLDAIIRDDTRSLHNEGAWSGLLSMRAVLGGGDGGRRPRERAAWVTEREKKRQEVSAFAAT